MLANLKANSTIVVGCDSQSGLLLGGADGSKLIGDVTLEDIYVKFEVITSHGGETGLPFSPSEE